MPGPNPPEQITAPRAHCAHPLVLGEAVVPLADALAAAHDVMAGIATHSEVVDSLILAAERLRDGEGVRDVSDDLDLADIDGVIADWGEFVHDCPFCLTEHSIPMEELQ